GTDTALAVPLGSPEAMRAEFERQYRASFSFLMPDRKLIVEAVSVEATAKGERERPAAAAPMQAGARLPKPTTIVPMTSGGKHHQTPVYVREQLLPGVRITGPAIIA